MVSMSYTPFPEDVFLRKLAMKPPMPLEAIIDFLHRTEYLEKEDINDCNTSSRDISFLEEKFGVQNGHGNLMLISRLERSKRQRLIESVQFRMAQELYEKKPRGWKVKQPSFEIRMTPSTAVGLDFPKLDEFKTYYEVAKQHAPPCRPSGAIENLRYLAYAHATNQQNENQLGTTRQSIMACPEQERTRPTPEEQASFYETISLLKTIAHKAEAFRECSELQSQGKLPCEIDGSSKLEDVNLEQEDMVRRSVLTDITSEECIAAPVSEQGLDINGTDCDSERIHGNNDNCATRISTKVSTDGPCTHDGMSKSIESISSQELKSSSFVIDLVDSSDNTHNSPVETVTSTVSTTEHCTENTTGNCNADTLTLSGCESMSEGISPTSTNTCHSCSSLSMENKSVLTPGNASRFQCTHTSKGNVQLYSSASSLESSTSSGTSTYSVISENKYVDKLVQQGNYQKTAYYGKIDPIPSRSNLSIASTDNIASTNLLPDIIGSKRDTGLAVTSDDKVRSNDSPQSLSSSFSNKSNMSCRREVKATRDHYDISPRNTMFSSKSTGSHISHLSPLKSISTSVSATSKSKRRVPFNHNNPMETSCLGKSRHQLTSTDKQFVGHIPSNCSTTTVHHTNSHRVKQNKPVVSVPKNNATNPCSTSKAKDSPSNKHPKPTKASQLRQKYNDRGTQSQMKTRNMSNALGDISQTNSATITNRKTSLPVIGKKKQTKQLPMTQRIRETSAQTKIKLQSCFPVLPSQCKAISPIPRKCSPANANVSKHDSIVTKTVKRSDQSPRTQIKCKSVDKAHVKYSNSNVSTSGQKHRGSTNLRQNTGSYLRKGAKSCSI